MCGMREFFLFVQEKISLKEEQKHFHAIYIYLRWTDKTLKWRKVIRNLSVVISSLKRTWKRLKCVSNYGHTISTLKAHVNSYRVRWKKKKNKINRERNAYTHRKSDEDSVKREKWFSSLFQTIKLKRLKPKMIIRNYYQFFWCRPNISDLYWAFALFLRKHRQRNNSDLKKWVLDKIILQ